MDESPEERRLRRGREKSARWLADPENAEKNRERSRYHNRKPLPDTRKRNQQARRLRDLEAYGGKCACCGEARFQFLQLHHINEGGKNAHYAELGVSSNATYWTKMRTLGYPSGICQVLCCNCHQAITHYGDCPHTLTDELSAHE